MSNKVATDGITMVRMRVNCFTGYLVEESEVEMEANDFIKVSMEIFG